MSFHDSLTSLSMLNACEFCRSIYKGGGKKRKLYDNQCLVLFNYFYKHVEQCNRKT